MGMVFRDRKKKVFAYEIFKVNLTRFSDGLNVK